MVYVLLTLHKLPQTLTCYMNEKCMKQCNNKRARPMYEFGLIHVIVLLAIFFRNGSDWCPITDMQILEQMNPLRIQAYLMQLITLIPIKCEHKTHLKADIKCCTGLHVLIITILFARIDVHFVIHCDSRKGLIPGPGVRLCYHILAHETQK